MILVVTLNLAIDHIVEVDSLVPAAVQRSVRTERRAGGKGVNVARVLAALGERSVLAGLLGGPTGDEIRKQLEDEGIVCEATRIAGDSRCCVIIDDAATNAQTVINDPGPVVSGAEFAAFLNLFDRLIERADLVVLAGSMPPGVPDDAYGQMVSAANAANLRVLIDMTGDALVRALEARPYFVKVNEAEAGGLGYDGLAKLGAKNVMITRGARGAGLLYAGVLHEAEPPRVEARNTVGSGDAAMAGLAAGVVRNLPGEELLRLAMVCGAANAIHGMGRVSAEDLRDADYSR